MIVDYLDFRLTPSDYTPSPWPRGTKVFSSKYGPGVIVNDRMFPQCCVIFADCAMKWVGVCTGEVVKVCGL